MASINNRANQLNPNNWRFWKSRGYSGRPSQWESLMGDFTDNSSSCCCSICCKGCICKYVIILTICLSFFLVFYLLAKGLGDKLILPSVNSTKILLTVGNDSMAMSDTGLKFLMGNLTNSTLG